MKRDLGDIIDRYVIVSLKKERLGTEKSIKEFKTFDKEIKKIHKKYKSIIRELDSYIKIMRDINSFIWELESGIKSGKEQLKNPLYLLDKDNEEALINIGITTVLIRNYNHLRIQIKNLINKLVNEGFEEEKKDHLSE